MPSGECWARNLKRRRSKADGSRRKAEEMPEPIQLSRNAKRYVAVSISHAAIGSGRPGCRAGGAGCRSAVVSGRVVRRTGSDCGCHPAVYRRRLAGQTPAHERLCLAHRTAAVFADGRHRDLRLRLAAAAGHRLKRRRDFGVRSRCLESRLERSFERGRCGAQRFERGRQCQR